MHDDILKKFCVASSLFFTISIPGYVCAQEPNASVKNETFNERFEKCMKDKGYAFGTKINYSRTGIVAKVTVNKGLIEKQEVDLTDNSVTIYDDFFSGIQNIKHYPFRELPQTLLRTFNDVRGCVYGAKGTKINAGPKASP